MTKCATTWTDKDGKTYCFSGDDAKKSFLEKPAENLQSARAFMAASSVESTEKAMEDFSGTDAEALVKATIDAKLKANNGIFPIDDNASWEKNAATLRHLHALRDRVRTLERALQNNKTATDT